MPPPVLLMQRFWTPAEFVLQDVSLVQLELHQAPLHVVGLVHPTQGDEVELEHGSPLVPLVNAQTSGGPLVVVVWHVVPRKDEQSTFVVQPGKHA
jgi:hypothetical protein